MLSCFIPIFQVLQLVSAAVASAVLFVFAGLTLAGTVVALIIVTPIFVIFSPILVPATIATTLSAASALFGVTAILLIVWLIKHRVGVKPKDNPPPSGAPPTAAGEQAKKSRSKSSERSTSKSSERSTEESFGGSIKKSFGGSTDKSAGEAKNKSGDEMSGGSTDKAGGGADEMGGGAAKKPGGGLLKKMAGGMSNKPTGGASTDKPAGNDKQHA